VKIGLISDIHGNSPALESVLPALLNEVDQIIFLGDLCGYYPFVNECVSLWDEGIIGIRGNHDDVLLRCVEKQEEPGIDYQMKYGSALTRTLRTLSESSLSLLQSLPVSRILELNGAKIALYHGAPWDALEGRVYPDYEEWERFSGVPGDVILLGQTHYPLIRRHRDKLIVNPGSVGQPRDQASRACFAILDLDRATVQQHRVPFDPRRLFEDATRYDPGIPYLVDVLVRS